MIKRENTDNLLKRKDRARRSDGQSTGFPIADRGARGDEVHFTLSSRRPVSGDFHSPIQGRQGD